MHHSQQAFSVKNREKKQLTFMSTVMFWHTHTQKKTFQLELLHLLRTCVLLKAGRLTSCFGESKENMVMSHGSVRIRGSLADRQVLLLLVCLFPCFVLPLNVGTAVFQKKDVFFVVVNDKTQDSSKVEVEDLVEWSCTLWFGNDSTAASGFMKGIFKERRKVGEGK